MARTGNHRLKSRFARMAGVWALKVARRKYGVGKTFAELHREMRREQRRRLVQSMFVMATSVVIVLIILVVGMIWNVL